MKRCKWSVNKQMSAKKINSDYLHVTKERCPTPGECIALLKSSVWFITFPEALSSDRLCDSSFCVSFVTGHICQPFSGGRYVLCLQHWRLQVSGWYDSAYPTQPEIPLCILYCSHQQETAFCLHLFPKGEPNMWRRHEMNGGKLEEGEREEGLRSSKTEEECVNNYL